MKLILFNFLSKNATAIVDYYLTFRSVSLSLTKRENNPAIVQVRI